MQTLSGFRDMQTNPITEFAKAYPEFVTTPLELELVTNLFRSESSGYQRIHENEMLKKMSMLDKECAIIEGRLDGTVDEAAIAAFIEHDGVLPELHDLPPASHQASRDDEGCSERAPLNDKEKLKLVRCWAQLNRERRRGRMALAGRWSEM